MKIYPIVEGYGDVEAVPILLRRLRDEASAFHIDIARPHRRHRSELTNVTTLKKAVQIVLKNSDCGAVIVIFDADDDCPKVTAPNLEKIIEIECHAIPSGLVMANREFETWFLANVGRFADFNGMINTAAYAGDPEIPRDAKGTLEGFMGHGFFYQERPDQPRLAAKMDLVAAYKRCRSFRKLTSVFGRILATNSVGSAWPPPHWQYDP